MQSKGVDRREAPSGFALVFRHQGDTETAYCSNLLLNHIQGASQQKTDRERARERGRASKGERKEKARERERGRGRWRGKEKKKRERKRRKGNLL